jgi:hypothetical protein
MGFVSMAEERMVVLRKSAAVSIKREISARNKRVQWRFAGGKECIEHSKLFNFPLVNEIKTMAVMVMDHSKYCDFHTEEMFKSRVEDGPIEDKTF